MSDFHWNETIGEFARVLTPSEPVVFEARVLENVTTAIRVELRLEKITARHKPWNIGDMALPGEWPHVYHAVDNSGKRYTALYFCLCSRDDLRFMTWEPE